MKKGIFIFFFTIIFFTPKIKAAMFPDEQGLIEIHGSKKTMSDHIITVLAFNSDRAFKNTHIITYENDTFHLVGTVTNCPGPYFSMIHQHHYTYIPFYASIKVQDHYEDFGAILVGHKDKKLALNVALHSVDILSPFKKEGCLACNTKCHKEI